MGCKICINIKSLNNLLLSLSFAKSAKNLYKDEKEGLPVITFGCYEKSIRGAKNVEIEQENDFALST